MLRHKTKTRPGLVALYDIRPGNGAGPFLQPRSPHGAKPSINRQDRQKITFHGSAYPKKISQQCTPATHTEAVYCQGSSIPVSDHWRLLDPPWGRVVKPLISPLMPVFPGWERNMHLCYMAGVQEYS